MKNYFYSVIITFISYSGIAQKDSLPVYSVKIAPLQFVVGEINFAFEHRITKASSIEVSAGPIIHFDWMMTEIFMPNLAGHGFYYGDLNIKNGGFVGIEYRYYPFRKFGNAPKGLYVANIFKYRINTIGFRHGKFSLEEKNEHLHQIIGQIHIGHQSWIKKSFTINLFLGISFNYSILQAPMTSKSNSTEAFPQYNWSGTKTLNKLTPITTTGVKFGFGTVNKKIKNSNLD